MPFLRLNFWVAVFAIASLPVAVVGVLLTYLTLNEPEPRVVFETISDTNVLDLHRPLQDLGIVFRGQNIHEQGLNLRIMTINVVNSGEVNILSGHYDQEDDWGMKFEGGEVVEARLVDTNSEYLRPKIVPQRLGTDTVAFPRVIFEKGDFFTIEVLLLHPRDESPSMAAVGKIAGINEIIVLTQPLAKREVSFIAQVFQGNALVQVVRAILYLIGSLAAIVAVVLALVGVTEFLRKRTIRRRGDRISETLTIQRMDQDHIKKILVELYASDGINGLKGLRRLSQERGASELPTPQCEILLRGQYQAVGSTPTDRDIESIIRSVDSYHAMEAWSKVWGLMVGADDATVIRQKVEETVDELLVELER